MSGLCDSTASCERNSVTAGCVKLDASVKAGSVRAHVSEQGV